MIFDAWILYMGTANIYINWEIRQIGCADLPYFPKKAPGNRNIVQIYFLIISMCFLLAQKYFFRFVS